MFREAPDRELGFQVEFLVLDGTLSLDGVQVGTLTGGQLVAPLPAVYRRFDGPAGAYGVEAGGGATDSVTALPDEVVLEPMGSIDVVALRGQLPLPSHWKVIPEELMQDLELSVRVRFESVTADEEYRLNEPEHLELAQKAYEGTWRLACQVDLGFNVPVDAGQVALDRREFELDVSGRFLNREP